MKNQFNLPENVEHVANVNTKWITIPEDKLRNIFYEYLSALKSSQSWIAPLSLLGSIGLTLVTTKFVDIFSIPAATWQAIYIIVLLGSAFKTIRNGAHALMHRRETSVQFLISKIAEKSNQEE